MTLRDAVGEIAVGAGDEFNIQTDAGAARVEMLFADEEGQICCRVRAGLVAVPGIKQRLGPASIIYLPPGTVATAWRASSRGEGATPAVVLAFDSK